MYSILLIKTQEEIAQHEQDLEKLEKGEQNDKHING